MQSGAMSALSGMPNAGIQSEGGGTFLQINGVAERCSALLRNLRNQVTQAHAYLSVGFESEQEMEKYRARLEKFAKDITDDYEKLETEANLLPAQTPMIPMVNRLNAFLLDNSTNINTVETYLNARDAFDWSDSTGHYINFVYEFLKPSGGNQRGRKLSMAQSFSDRTPVITRHSALENPHRRFEEVFRHYIQSQENPKIRYTYKHLERSTISSILEVKLVSIANPRDGYVPVLERQHVCLLKMLLLVNNGVIEYIQFIAPEEDWTYLGSNARQIDLSAESRYDLYRRLTTQGNIVIHTISSQAASDIRNGIQWLLNFTLRFHMIDQPCRLCKKILKDFSPATVCDTKKIFFHLTCR